MQIKLITLDLDNTLWHTDPVIKRAEEAQWQRAKELNPSLDQHFTAEKLQELKINIASQHPELRHKLSKLRLEFLYQVFIASGSHDQQARLFSEQTFSVFLQVRNQVTLFPDALNLLQSLQQNYHVIALSNGNADLKAIGIDHLFDAHFHAENVDQPKPHSDMFLAALEYANVQASESIHIGDHPDQDILAAQQLGFNTIWANILGQQWPLDLIPADNELSQISQLTRILTQYR